MPVAFVATVITVLIFNNLYPSVPVVAGGVGIFAFWFGIAAGGHYLWNRGKH
ncbi:MAG TPA: hypothetical protein VMR62_08430 [Bryobacteraceae bacterium]|nr:hypothetical protein [Bryobacteraceae bacterium]